MVKLDFSYIIKIHFENWNQSHIFRLLISVESHQKWSKTIIHICTFIEFCVQKKSTEEMKHIVHFLQTARAHARAHTHFMPAKKNKKKKHEPLLEWVNSSGFVSKIKNTQNIRCRVEKSNTTLHFNSPTRDTEGLVFTENTQSWCAEGVSLVYSHTDCRWSSDEPGSHWDGGRDDDKYDTVELHDCEGNAHVRVRTHGGGRYGCCFLHCILS